MSRLRSHNSVRPGGEVLHDDLESSVSHSFAVERHRARVHQMRERYLSFDVEVLADAFPIFQGAMVSPDLTCLLCNTAVVIDFVFRKWNNEAINIVSHRSVLGLFVGFSGFHFVGHDTIVT